MRLRTAQGNLFACVSEPRRATWKSFEQEIYTLIALHGVTFCCDFAWVIGNFAQCDVSVLILHGIIRNKSSNDACKVPGGHLRDLLRHSDNVNVVLKYLCKISHINIFRFNTFRF